MRSKLKQHMNPILFVMSIALLFLSFSVNAETRGFIWKIEKEDGHSYLLGSVHFANSSFYPLSKNIMSAYHESDVLLVEVDESTIPEPEKLALMTRYGVYGENKTLRSELKPRTLNLIESLLREHRVSLAAVEKYRPGMLAVTLTTLQASKLGYSAAKGIDVYFMQKARGRKPIRQMESFDFQMRLLGDLPQDDEILYENFKEMQDYKMTWTTLMQAWKEGDGETIYREMVGEPLSANDSMKAYFEALLFERHPNMLAKTEQCFEAKETCFIVVGAGHLVGEQGLLAMLKAKGYRYEQL